MGATEGFNYVLEKFSRQQASLRELGTVKLAEFQVKKDLLREGMTERVESMKEGVTEKVEHMRERSREMKERAKETAAEVKGAAEFTAKEVTERVKANATLHAAED